MKRILLTAMCLLIPCAVLADEQIKEAHGVLDLNDLSARLETLEYKLNNITTRVAKLEDVYINTGARVDLKLKEHDRILSGKDGKGGVQKQVTILHAKVDALESRCGCK